MDKKIANLIAYCTGITQKENGSQLYKKYIDDIKTITPNELMLVQNEQLKMGLAPNAVLLTVDKLMNVFHESLSNYKLSEPIKHKFIHYLNEENKVLISILGDFKNIIKNESLAGTKKLTAFMTQIKQYNEHLLKLENILFPYLEKHDERFDGLQIMWALHEETRSMIKNLETETNNPQSEKTLKQRVAYLYFILYGVVQKQELILFPVAVNFATDEEFRQMHTQSFDYEFPFIHKPNALLQSQDTIKAVGTLAGMFVSDTGCIKLDDFALVLDALPFDLTFVDANDEVAYFSKLGRRIFPRSKASIGRNVRNCHPPKSVHIVEKILQSFKSGQKDEAVFWINIKGMMVLIKYICLRSGTGQYKGTLEIVQEIDDIRALHGEKRLLDWE